MTNSLHSRFSVLSCGLALALSSGVAAADPPEATRSVHRLDVSVTTLDDGAHAAPATYTLILQENQTGTVSVGANVPLVVAPGGGAAAPRQDVGLTVHLSYSMRGAVVLVAGSVEMTSVDGSAATSGARTIHRVRAEGVTPVTPGTDALFSRIDDVAGHRHYEITVAARRLL